MKKIYKIVLLFFILLLLIYSLNNIFNKNNVDKDKISQSTNKSENVLSMMLETGIETGEYEMATSDKWPSSGYTFNSELSRCENGGELSWDNANKAVIMSGNVSDKCYIYFDKDFVRLSLDNYTFKWDAVEGASTYQVYSDGELLTTTSDTSAEIYGLYNEAGNYEISVKALDNSGKVIKDSNVYNYQLEEFEFNISNEYVKKETLNYQEHSYNGYSYVVSFVINETVFAIDDVVNVLTISNERYKINYIDATPPYAKDIFPFYEINHYNNLMLMYTNNETVFKKNYCNLNSNCISFELNDFTYTSKYSKIYYDINSSTIKSIVLGGNYEPNIHLFQLISPGKVFSDWYMIRFYTNCLSSNTDVYVYDKKKKRFKKKKISEVDYDDELLCWDFDNGCFATAKPIWIMKEKQTFKYNKLTFSDGSILETINQHRIFNVEKGMFTYPMTDDTPIGTTTINANGEYVKLVSKEVIEKPIDYYNVMTEYHINIFANDILTSCRLSNMYPIEDLKYVCNEKRSNGYDFSCYSEDLVKGLRLNEQNIEEKDLKEYVDNMLRNKK